MKDLENFISENIKKLVPNYDIIELKATITSSSLSVEFFATVNSQKKISINFQKILPIMLESYLILIKKVLINILLH